MTGSGCLRAAQIFVNPDGGALAVADAVDDQPRAKHAIAAGENPGRGGHQRMRIHIDQAARAKSARHRRGAGNRDPAACPMAMMTVSHSIWVSLFSIEGGVEAAVLVENRLRLQAFERRDFAVFADEALGSESGMQDDAFGLGLFDFFERRRHLLALLQADDVYFLRAHAQRGERDVDHFFGGDGGHIFFGGRRLPRSPPDMLAQDFARGRARHVHGDVAAADDEHVPADGELVSEIDVEQEIDAAVYAIQIHAGNGEVAAAVRADGQQNGVESLPPQFGRSESRGRRGD